MSSLGGCIDGTERGEGYFRPGGDSRNQTKNNMKTETQYREEPYKEARMQELKGVPGVMLKYGVGKAKYSYRFTSKDGSVGAESEEGRACFFLASDSPYLTILVPIEKTYVPFDIMEEVPFGALVRLEGSDIVGTVTGFSSDYVCVYHDRGLISRTLKEGFIDLKIIHQNPDGTIKCDENGNWIANPFGKEVAK